MLEKERIITITRPSKRLMLIKLNQDYNELIKFSDLCQTEGKALQELFLGKILNND